MAAPGRTLYTTEVSLSAAGEVEIEVPPIGGTLAVSFPERHRNAVLRANGLPLVLQEVIMWMRGHREEYSRTPRIPNLAPGPYEVCAIAMASKEGEPDRRVCASGILAPGGTLVLDLTR